MAGGVVIDDHELREAVRFLEANVSGALEAGLQAGGRVLENAWEENIVAMDIIETGTYLRSVHTQVTGRLEVTVGTDIADPPYPSWMEFGTSKIPARPAARNAVDTHREQAEQEVVNSLKGLFGRYT